MTKPMSPPRKETGPKKPAPLSSFFPPSILAWNDGTIVKMAEAIQRNRHFADLPILADALEEAGWTYQPILRQLRKNPAHAGWVLNLILRPDKMDEEQFARNLLRCVTIADLVEESKSGVHRLPKTPIRPNGGAFQLPPGP